MPMNALISSQNMPKVRMVRGSVTIFRRTPIVPFINPITTAAMSAVPKPYNKARHQAGNQQEAKGAQNPMCQ
jgi:hypothetical protein